MDAVHSIRGMVELEITSADVSGALGAIAESGIEIFHTRQVDDLTAGFQVAWSDFGVVKQALERRGDSVHLLGRSGIYWAAKALLGRRVLIAGIFLFLVLILFLPSRVLFIRVEGNAALPENRILEAAEQSGIFFGASRRAVRSERVKNALLEALPELSWAGVNTYGCVAVISVRERTTVEQTESESNHYGNIIALRDGVITACTATQGNLLCAPGQAVLAGEVLVSGYIDCGICIQAVQAEGEIYAQTRRSLTAITPTDCQIRGESTGETKKISLLIGKNRINLWKDSSISDPTCGRIYEEYYLTLPGGFRLPLAVAVETYTYYDFGDGSRTQEQGEVQLTAFAQEYVSGQMVAGRIDSQVFTLTLAEGCWRLESSFICTEMIGKRQRIEIGGYDGENH